MLTEIHCSFVMVFWYLFIIYFYIYRTSRNSFLGKKKLSSIPFRTHAGPTQKKVKVQKWTSFQKSPNPAHSASLMGRGDDATEDDAVEARNGDSDFVDDKDHRPSVSSSDV